MPTTLLPPVPAPTQFDLQDLRIGTFLHLYHANRNRLVSCLKADVEMYYQASGSVQTLNSEQLLDRAVRILEGNDIFAKKAMATRGMTRTHFGELLRKLARLIVHENRSFLEQMDFDVSIAERQKD